MKPRLVTMKRRASDFEDWDYKLQLAEQNPWRYRRQAAVGWAWLLTGACILGLYLWLR